MPEENEKPSDVIEGEVMDNEEPKVVEEEEEDQKEKEEKMVPAEAGDGKKEEKEERKEEQEEEKATPEDADAKARENGGENHENHEVNADKKNGKKKTVAGEDGGGGLGSGGFEIVAIKEKHGQMRKAVPVMPLPLAIVLCLVNVVLPGIGTLVSAFVVFCGGKTEYDSKGKAFGLNVIAAILQLVTLPIIVGWIWSIVWGVTFVTSAMSKEEANKDGTQVPPPEHV